MTVAGSGQRYGKNYYVYFFGHPVLSSLKRGDYGVEFLVKEMMKCRKIIV